MFYILCWQVINHSLRKSNYPFACNFSLCSSNKLYKMISEGIYDVDECEPWPSISETAKDLIKKLLTVDPSQRITAE